MRQFLQLSGIHPLDKLLSVDAMNRQDVVFVEYDLVALTQLMEPNFVERIVHRCLEELTVTLADSHPKVFAPAS